MYKVGIIGYGKMGQIRHQVISAFEDVQVQSIYDPEIVDTEIEKAQNSDQIIENPEIDAVFTCTPNYLNKPLTIQSLKAGKHVFCEKPPAFTAKDIEEIRAVEKESGKVLMYGFNHRHHASIKYMKKLVDDKEFGKILWMRGRYGKSVDETFYDNWRAKKELAGGGILIDQGIHMLDLFLHLGGNFDNVHASVSNLYWNLSVEDNVFATLENTKTGLAASLHSTMTQWRHLVSLEVFLEKGYLVLNGLKTSSNAYGEEILTIAKNRSTAPAATWKDEKNITYHTDESWESELTEFFSAIKSNREVKLGNSSDALKLMKIVDKIYSFKKKEK
jgi:predicted dehydrogenase|tara:strand:+ start:1250 stop:2242 length:993 start_codon:yes stop_codon:yes gene_type:complete